MQNIYREIAANNLQDQIKVLTAKGSSLLRTSSLSSAGRFTGVCSFINPIISFLISHGSPLLLNLYPYFSYTGNKGSISLEYAMFTSPGTVVSDGQYNYENLFDAILDAHYAALGQINAPNLQIVVSESGWPSEGGDAATGENAGTYFKNLMNHVSQGTPRKSGQAIETYLFAMFDENQKASGIEQHWDLFFPSKLAKYQLNFS